MATSPKPPSRRHARPPRLAQQVRERFVQEIDSALLAVGVKVQTYLITLVNTGRFASVTESRQALDTEAAYQREQTNWIDLCRQRLQDAPAKDLREGRYAAENIVPTTTGAAIAVTKALPQLEGKFDGLSIRVPTPVVSLSDVTVLLEKDATVELINDAFKRASETDYYRGILGVTEEPLVSSDFIGNSHSGIVDLPLTKVVGGNLAKVMVWYDNEWGYSNRLVELVADVGHYVNKG